MFGWLNRFRKREDGIAAVELGLATPVFLLMFLSVTELGHMIYYSIAIEKGMRSGVTYAARNKLDLITDPVQLMMIEIKTRNLTMTGTMDGSGDFLVPGYEMALAEGQTPVTYKVVQFTSTVGGVTVSVPIVTLSVKVPYVPLVPFITRAWTQTPETWIELEHEQAVIGD